MRLLQLVRFLCFKFLLLHRALLNPSILPFLNLLVSLLLCTLDHVAVIPHLATSNFGTPPERRFLCALGYTESGHVEVCWTWGTYRCGYNRTAGKGDFRTFITEIYAVYQTYLALPRPLRLSFSEYRNTLCVHDTGFEC